MKNLILSLFLNLFFTFLCDGQTEQSFMERLQPVPKESGFKMEGYYVWCGSVIKVGKTYHMFAARWPKSTGFPEGYRNYSEIVRAVADNPLGPYKFKEVVIAERDSSFWDSNMAHNPTIHKIGKDYVLFYIGSDFTTKQPNNPKGLLRRIGYASATNIAGPWKRMDKPVMEVESNNPAVLVETDGSVKMMFRDAELKVSIASASGYGGPYRVVSENIWPANRLEDFYFFKKNATYAVICEDNVGGVTGHERWGAMITSPDGVHGWKAGNDATVYDHNISYTDGTVLHCTRRERPQLIIQNGKVTHLITAVYDGSDTWSQPVEVKPGF